MMQSRIYHVCWTAQATAGEPDGSRGCNQGNNWPHTKKLGATMIFPCPEACVNILVSDKIAFLLQFG